MIAQEIFKNYYWQIQKKEGEEFSGDFKTGGYQILGKIESGDQVNFRMSRFARSVNQYLEGVLGKKIDFTDFLWKKQLLR